MNNLKSNQLAMIFTGSFLGAGFVSGQEILQFFAVYGKMGIVGMFVSVCLFGLFGYMFMYIAKKENLTSIDQIIMGEGKSILHRFLNIVSLLFLFGVTVIMLAGAGSLLQELLGIPFFIGSAVLTILLAILSLKGMNGILVISQIVVPVLLVLVVIISIWSVLVFEPSHVSKVQIIAYNPLLGNWFVAMITFFSYNILASVAVLIPATHKIPDLSTAKKGIGMGSFQLLLMFACILISIQRFFGELQNTDFPIQALAGRLSPILATIYAVLLLSAMFNGALSCMYGAVVQLFGDVVKKSWTLILWAAAFVCSLAGFKELISVIFPICGYAYLIAIPIVLWRFLQVRKKQLLKLKGE